MESWFQDTVLTSSLKVHYVNCKEKKRTHRWETAQPHYSQFYQEAWFPRFFFMHTWRLSPWLTGYLFLSALLKLHHCNNSNFQILSVMYSIKYNHKWLTLWLIFKDYFIASAFLILKWIYLESKLYKVSIHNLAL